VIARIVALFTLAAAIAVFATAPLEAQRTGTRLGGNAKKSDPEAVLRVVAQCAADRKPAYALALLDALPGSDEESRQFRRGLGDLSNCMDYDRNLAVGSDIMTASALAFRLMLVEQMVANRLKSPVDTAAIGGGEPWFLALIPEGESEVQADARYMVLMEFGDCVVSAAPSQSVAFISATPGTAGEQTAIQGLVPFLGPCIASGDEIQLTPAMLRRALSEPLYHRMAQAG
jgi:hypothetical protein|tara:strand:+ start:1198 stop:1887 length:690 start_codon:yes stop_codon:yes gene_type:complete